MINKRINSLKTGPILQSFAAKPIYASLIYLGSSAINLHSQIILPNMGKRISKNLAFINHYPSLQVLLWIVEAALIMEQTLTQRFPGSAWDGSFSCPLRYQLTSRHPRAHLRDAQMIILRLHECR